MNNTEKFIKRIYESINICSPDQLTISNVAEKMNLGVDYWPYTSVFAECKGRCKVFINENLNKQQQWQDFSHEMGHYFQDGGCHRQFIRHYINYREIKADYFAYHFCVPTFMLLKIKGVDVYDVMNLFNVEFDFALRRLEMYKNKILENKIVYERAYY